MQELFSSLYAYNEWANEKITQLCDGLTDAQLDQPKEMGMGTLRATLFHTLTADIVWMERWESTPCLLYTSPSPRDATLSRMPSSA